MEHLLQEMRADIKTVIVTQARIEEKMAQHSEEMREHKAETKEEFKEVEARIKPLLRHYNGLKWLFGAMLFLVPVIGLAIKVL